MQTLIRNMVQEMCWLENCKIFIYFSEAFWRCNKKIIAIVESWLRKLLICALLFSTVQLYRLERFNECKTVYTDLIRNSQDEYEEERKTNLSAVVASISQWENTPLVIFDWICLHCSSTHRSVFCVSWLTVGSVLICRKILAFPSRPTSCVTILPALWLAKDSWQRPSINYDKQKVGAARFFSFLRAIFNSFWNWLNTVIVSFSELCRVSLADDTVSDVLIFFFN